MAQNYRELARETAIRNGVDPDLFLRLVEKESNFNPEARNEKSGAIGLGQLMPGTAADLGVDPWDPPSNLEGSARYLKQQLKRFGGDYRKATAAYNAGPENVEKYGGIPPFPETQDYVAKVAGGGYKANGRTVADLGRMVKRLIRAKYAGIYPNDYQHIPDAELGARFKQKYPAYSGFLDITDAGAAPAEGGEPSEAAPAAAPTAPAPGPRAPSSPAMSGMLTTDDVRRARAASGAPAGPQAAAEPPPSPETLAFEKERYESLPLAQRAILRFASGAARSLPSLEDAPSRDRYPEGTGLVERAAETLGGAAGFSAVALPVAAATQGLGAGPLLAGSVGAGVAAGAAPGTMKERAIRGGTSALAAAGAGLVGNQVAGAVSKRLAKDAPQVARALEQEFQANLAKGMSVQEAQRIVRDKIAQATDAAIRRAEAIMSGAGAVSGATAFGVGQPLAEYGAMKATGEDVQPPRPEQLVESGLELLALNVILGGRRLARGVTAKGIRAEGQLPQGLQHVSPTPAEAAAARDNIKPPPMKPGWTEVSNEASSALAKVVTEAQSKAKGGIKFEGGGLKIDDAYVIPSLVRVFPGDPKSVRVTVVDNATGKIHSIGLKDIAELKKAIGYVPPPVQKVPITVPQEEGGFELPPFTKIKRAVVGAPQPKGKKAKKVVESPPVEAPLPPGQIVTREQFAEAKEAGIRAAARREEIARNEAQRRAEAQERARKDVRTQEVSVAIAKLQKQIAERPGDRQINRWRRRLATLQKEEKALKKAAKAAPKPTYQEVPKGSEPGAVEKAGRRGSIVVMAEPPPANLPEEDIVTRTAGGNAKVTFGRKSEERFARATGEGGGPTSFAEERGQTRRASVLGKPPAEGERRGPPRRAEDRKQLEQIAAEAEAAIKKLEGATSAEARAMWKRRWPDVKPPDSTAALKEEMGRELRAIAKGSRQILEGKTVRGRIPAEGKTAPPVEEFPKGKTPQGEKARQDFRKQLLRELEKEGQTGGRVLAVRNKEGMTLSSNKAGSYADLLKQYQEKPENVVEVGYLEGEKFVPKRAGELGASLEDVRGALQEDVDQGPVGRPGFVGKPAAPPAAMPKLGVMLETGKVFKSSSGRALSPAPRIDLANEIRTINTLRRVDAWLVKEALIEAKGKDYLETIIRGMNPKKLSPSDREALNDILFGDLPPGEAGPKPAPKPKPTPPKAPAPPTAAPAPRKKAESQPIVRPQAEPLPMTERKKGELARGDVVTGTKATRSGGRGVGFILEVKGEGAEARVTVRWSSEMVTAQESGKNLKLVPGVLRANEEQVKRIEAVPDLKPWYGPRSGEPKPPDREEIENRVFSEMRSMSGFRPMDELTFRPKAAYNISGNRAWWNEKFITDGHILLFTPHVDPKVSQQLKEMSPVQELDESLTEKAVKSVTDDAMKGKLTQLKPAGFLPPSGQGDDNMPLTFLYNEKERRLVGVDPQKFKLVTKAVEPDAFAQGTAKTGKHGERPIVLYRKGEVVGIVMPLRFSDHTRELASRMLFGFDKPVAESGGDVDASIFTGAPGRTRKPKGPPAPPAAPPAAPKPPRTGIPIATQAPKIPTEKESIGLPEHPLPPQAGKRTAAPAKALEKFREALREVVAIANPVKLAAPGMPQSSRNLDVIMRKKGEVKRALFRTEQAQRHLHVYWEKRTKEEKLDFLNKLETGKNADPRLEAIAESYRQRADNVYNAIAMYRSIPYWENWFPHIWKNTKRAEQVFFQRRPLEGSKRFLKRRFFSDTLEGLKAGLEPVSWNLEDLMLMAEDSARRYVAFQEMLKEYKAIGSFKFVRVGKRPPKGFRRPDQNWARVYLNPEIPVEEYFDRKMMAGLMAAAKRLGVKHSRLMNLKMRGALGLSYKGAPEIETKFASPLSVIAHELGHQIDNKYGLKLMFLKEPVATGKGSTQINKERIQVKKELQALADMRAEGQRVPPAYRAYLRSGSEKMAVMLEALIHAPELFKQVAPLTLKKLTEFLASKPELKPILDIKPSLTFGANESSVRAPGAVLGGEWWAQEDLARILDNYMSRDFITQTALGRTIMDSRNTLNAINLGLSAFHFTGTTMLAAMTKVAIGISDVAYGVSERDPLVIAKGILKAAEAPVAPYQYWKVGRRFWKGDPLLLELERQVFEGGASLETKQYYKNQAFDKFVKNAREAMSKGTPYQRFGGATRAMAFAPFAALEASMRLMTNYYIPQMKVGAFQDILASQLRMKSKDIAAGRDTETNVARVAWRDVEDRLGLVNYDNEFWNQTLKTSLMVLIRAPGWTLGTVRALGGGAFMDIPRFAYRTVRGGEKAPEWTQRMSFVLAMTIVTLAVGAIYQVLRTGEWPKNLEDYLHPRNGLKDPSGKPQRVSFPTFMKDVDAWLRDPIKTLVGRIPKGKGTYSLGHGGKLAPEVTLVMDLLENQSYRGPIRNVKDPWYEQAGQVARYIFGREQPFSVSGARRIAKEGGDPGQIAESFIGITPYYPPRDRRERYRYREVEQ